MKWGTTELNIIKDSYMPPYAESKLNVIGILPGLGNTTPANILQQGGRGRYQVSFDGFVRSYSDYQALLTDALNMTERTFYGADDFEMTMIISEIQPKGRTLFPLKIDYSITMMEA